MVYTIQLDDSNPKAKALLEYLKTLDFIKLSNDSDWFNEISSEALKDIQEGLNDLSNGNIHSDKDVRNSIHNRILAYKK